MKLIKKCLCRGDGKLFIELQISGLTNNSSLCIEASTKEKKSIPSKLLKKKTDSAEYYVVVLPQICTSAYSFTITDTSNNQKASFSISSERAKWESRLNYRRKPMLCNDIRSFDSNYTINEIDTVFWECIPGEEFDVLHFSSVLPYYEDSELKVVCKNEALDEITNQPIAMGRSVEFSNGFKKCSYSYSVKLDKKPENILVEITDITHPELNGFFVCESAERNSLISDRQEIALSADANPEYTKLWHNSRPIPRYVEEQQNRVFSHSILFSIIVPLFNTPKNLFDEMVQSVLGQTYANWELILVNASPENSSLKSAVTGYSNSDARIKVLELKENKGISLNTKEGLKEAKGDFVCFLDHDDALEYYALYEYALALENDCSIDLLYCDEDKLLPNGDYAMPFFKPDFSIDLLRHVNYVCHFLCIRRSLFEKISPFEKEMDGAQDHDLILQVCEHTKNVHHVAKVLYHWRITENSTASNADAKPYAWTAGIKAVQNHLDRLGIKASVTEGKTPFTYHVEYLLGDEEPLVSIIIPSKDNIDILDTCLKSVINKTTYQNYEIVIIENNSTEKETFDYYSTLASLDNRIRVEYWPAEFNFSKLMNFGVEKANGEYLVLLNNDTELITSNWLETLVGICMREEVGVAGVLLYYPDDTIQHAGVCVTGVVAGHLHKGFIRGQGGYFGLINATQNLSAVTAACFMTKRSVFKEVSGFTEELSVAFNDVDYCLKVREKDYLVVYTPDVELYHYESLSRGYENNDQKKIRFLKEQAYMHANWANYYVCGDPYINSNITNAEPMNQYYGWKER